jgi:hypothetical protein
MIAEVIADIPDGMTVLDHGFVLATKRESHC